jgi:hypothetical protein
MKKLIVLIFINLCLAGSAWAIRNEYTNRIQTLSEEILITANDLKEETNEPVIDSHEIEQILTELKELIQDYENNMVFAQSQYPGEILLGTTPGGDGGWLDTLCSSRYGGLFKEIRIRRTGSRERYLRINDVAITSVTPAGPKEHVFNRAARFKLYRDGVFKLALPKPMQIRRIRINIAHESNGLEVYGIPFDTPVVKPRVRRNHLPSKVLLGTTSVGDGTWLQTICSNPRNRPVREIHLKRTGRDTSYLRINDIEVTFLSPRGMKKEVFNKGGRFRLYYDGVFKLILPRPMNITKIRVLVGHKSRGLKVYGIY